MVICPHSCSKPLGDEITKPKLLGPSGHYLFNYRRGTTCFVIDSVSNGEDYVNWSRDQDIPITYFLVDKKGKYVKRNDEKLEFFLMYPFSENIAVTVREWTDSFEFIDRTGKILFKKGKLLQDNSDSAGLEDHLSRLMTRASSNDFILKSFHEGFASINYDYGFGDIPKYGFIDSAGKVVIKPQFDEAYPFSEKLALIRQKNKYGFIDSAGKVAIKPQFDEAYPFSEGLAGIKVKNKNGFIDSAGKVVIKPQFDQIQSFREEVAAVKIKDKGWGFIDSAGKIVIKPQFDEAYSFSCGLAVVGKEAELD